MGPSRHYGTTQTLGPATSRSNQGRIKVPLPAAFAINLGTASGTDIESVAPKVVAAEVFAAVHPSNNRKLAKDLKKLALECPDADARYVFFGAPGFRHERQHKLETVDGIEVWGIDV